MDAFERRTRACQERLASRGAAAVLSPGPNQYYLSGFHEEQGERPLLLFVPPEGDPTFVAPALYAEQVVTESWVDDVVTYADGEDPTALCRDVAADLGVADATLLLDDRMWAQFVLDLRDALPDADLALAGDVFSALRVQKDEAEIDALRRAADVADEAMRAVRERAPEFVGMTERAVAREVETLLYEAGAESTAFETVVGSGPNGAMPHHRHGDREIRPGDPVVFDFGARVDRYPSDQTRTLVPAGDPPAGFEAAHRAVRDAQAAAVDAAGPGVTAGAVDRAARSVIEEQGFGDAFIHRTGHGVGLEVHEEPYVVAGSDRELAPGMVFSVEPGVYREGAFGVRIEDLVLVTADGAERLNDTDRGWRP